MKKLLTLLIFLISIHVFADTYYVAPSDATPAGNDANAGTIAAPWLTWTKVYAEVSAGDTVYFRGGTYVISDSGYGLVSVVDDNDNKTTTELAHVHETKGTAEKFIQEKTKYIDQAEKVLKDAKEKMDKLRIKVIGEPKHEYLSERIKRGNK